MPSKPKFLLLALALAAVLITSLALAGDASAQNRKRFGRDGESFGPGQRLERMASHLDLTDEQKSAVAEIHEKSRARAVALRKEMLRLRNEMNGELLADEPSEKTVLDLTRKLGDLRTQMRENRMRDRLAVRELLTPEQRDKMLMMRGRLGGGQGPGHDGRGDRHGRGPGEHGQGFRRLSRDR